MMKEVTTPDNKDMNEDIEENASDDETMKQKTLHARNNYAPGEGNENFDLEKHLDPDAEVIDFEHCRIEEVKGLSKLKQVKSICLRNNLLKTIHGFNEVASTITELDLYDNQVKKMENLDELKDLEILDLSFNLFRKIQGLDNLTKLHKIFLLSNKFTQIENIGHLTNLKMLELGDNRIRKIENVSSLMHLEELYLGKNKITSIENLSSLSNLKILALMSNRITKIEGLESLVNLEQLYLSNNAIEKLEGLEHNLKLQTLDVAVNKIKKIENVEHLSDLEEFWANNNEIEDWNDVYVLEKCTKLETVYLEKNPLQTKFQEQYRRRIMAVLPNLKQIDATYTRSGM